MAFFLMFFTPSVETAEAGVLYLGRTFDSVPMGPHVDVYEDPGGSLSIADALKQKKKVKWFSNSSNDLNFGFTSATYFLKITLVNEAGDDLETFIEIAYPLLDHIKVDILRGGRLSEGYLLGDSYPFSARIIEHRNFIVPLHFAQGETVEVIFKVKTKSSMQIPLRLVKDKALISGGEFRNLVYGMYYGVMIAMVLYNLFVFVSVREVCYLYYVFYVISMAMLLCSLNGFSYQYLWPESIRWNDQAVVVCIGSLVLFAHLFTRIFLDFPGNKPRMNLCSIYISLFLFFNLVLCVILPYATMILPAIGVSMVMVCFSLFSGVVRCVDGYSPARYYTVSWLAMLLGGVVLAINKLGFLPQNGLTENALQIGSVLEVLLLSFALAERLSTEKTERYDAQLAALRHEQVALSARAKALKHEREARLAQDEALAIQKKANENLENNVRLRTRELEIVNTRLRELSTTDSLTGLKNRRFFNEIYYSEYNRCIRDKTPLSCLIMDIDHFKNVNDCFGHLVGDECLKEVAATIGSQLMRENDFLARYGGEEFCVLLTNTSAEGALQVGENIRLCVEKLKVVRGGMTIPLTISIGVASEIPDHKKNAETLLNNADTALYHSKARGRNCVTFFEPEAKEEPVESWILHGEARYQALKKGEDFKGAQG